MRRHGVSGEKKKQISLTAANEKDWPQECTSIRSAFHFELLAIRLASGYQRDFGLGFMLSWGFRAWVLGLGVASGNKGLLGFCSLKTTALHTKP